jgi:hypothetical protein
MVGYTYENATASIQDVSRAEACLCNFRRPFKISGAPLSRSWGLCGAKQA